MIVRIESKARPCPGVERAITMAEDVLRREEILFSAGELIHNRREIERLRRMGLRKISNGTLPTLTQQKELNGSHFLVRTHGESEEIIQQAIESKLHIVDATCPIVQHSQTLINQHIKEGWQIIIAGNKEHAEVSGLLARTRGWGKVISTVEEAESFNGSDRSLLLAQTTIDPVFFSNVRKILTQKLTRLKIVDTTCRFLQNRKKDVALFCNELDVFILVGGNNSANCNLLYNTALEFNKRSYQIEGPDNINKKWFRENDRIGISGGASTPRWQLEEMKTYLDNHQSEKNPKGLKNRKGGKFLWWMRKNQSKME